MRVSLATAARLTGRGERTIGMWIATRELRPDEAVWTERTSGQGRVWQIDVGALRRVHRAHGGTRWHPEAARAAWPDEPGAAAADAATAAPAPAAPATSSVTPSSPPPQVAERLRQLEAELAWLSRLVHGLAEGGASASTASTASPAPAALAPTAPPRVVAAAARP